jgi:hypothetical protein
LVIADNSKISDLALAVYSSIMNVFFFWFCLISAFIAEAAFAQITNYASVRQTVAKAYPQQAEEMTQTLIVLQQLSESTVAAIAKIEATCGR